MNKKKLKFKIYEIKRISSGKDLNQIIDLIKKENDYSILSKLSRSLIAEYLQIAVKSENLFLFILKVKNRIIGYSLYAKNEKNLIDDFEAIKFKIFIYLLFSFKILSLINIFLAITKLDLIFINKKNYNRSNSLNLNLLAINRNFQSKGLGNIFLTKTIKIIYNKALKFNAISCEAPSIRAFKFYTKKKKI